MTAVCIHSACTLIFMLLLLLAVVVVPGLLIGVALALSFCTHVHREAHMCAADATARRLLLQDSRLYCVPLLQQQWQTQGLSCCSDYSDVRQAHAQSCCWWHCAQALYLASANSASVACSWCLLVLLRLLVWSAATAGFAAAGSCLTWCSV
jgi:hypothetical protein